MLVGDFRMVSLRSDVLRSLQRFLHLLRVFIDAHGSKDSECALEWQFTVWVAHASRVPGDCVLPGAHLATPPSRSRTFPWISNRKWSAPKNLFRRDAETNTRGRVRYPEALQRGFVIPSSFVIALRHYSVPRA